MRSNEKFIFCGKRYEVGKRRILDVGQGNVSVLCSRCPLYATRQGLYDGARETEEKQNNVSSSTFQAYSIDSYRESRRFSRRVFLGFARKHYFWNRLGTERTNASRSQLIVYVLLSQTVRAKRVRTCAHRRGRCLKILHSHQRYNRYRIGRDDKLFCRLILLNGPNGSAPEVQTLPPRQLSRFNGPPPIPTLFVETFGQTFVIRTQSVLYVHIYTSVYPAPGRRRVSEIAVYGLSAVVETIENYVVFDVRIRVRFIRIVARRNVRRTRRFGKSF